MSVGIVAPGVAFSPRGANNALLRGVTVFPFSTAAKISTRTLVPAVTPPISIGHGCSIRIIEAIRGTNATELWTFPKVKRGKDASQRIANAANANRPVQVVEEEAVGNDHTLPARSQASNGYRCYEKMNTMAFKEVRVSPRNVLLPR